MSPDAPLDQIEPETLRQRLVGRMPRAALVALTFVLVVGTWELFVVLAEVPQIILPAPSAILRSLAISLRMPTFYDHVGVTLLEVFAGFVVGSLLGFLLGMLISQFPTLETTLYPYIVAFQTLPKVSIAPIVLIWFGYGLTSKIVLTATMSFFPLLANTIAGMRASQQDHRELFIAFTSSRWQMFWKLKLPMALPYIFVGIDLSILLSVTGAIVGEFVGSHAGLGYLILQRNFDLDMPGLFAILVILAAIGALLHFLVQRIQRRVIFWMDLQDDRVIGA